MQVIRNTKANDKYIITRTDTQTYRSKLHQYSTLDSVSPQPRQVIRNTKANEEELDQRERVPSVDLVVRQLFKMSFLSILLQIVAWWGASFLNLSLFV